MYHFIDVSVICFFLVLPSAAVVRLWHFSFHRAAYFGGMGGLSKTPIKAEHHLTTHRPRAKPPLPPAGVAKGETGPEGPA